MFYGMSSAEIAEVAEVITGQHHGWRTASVSERWPTTA
jgi:hypothetical protein